MHIPPRWVLWISFVFFILIGIGLGISVLYQLSIIYIEPAGIVFGEILFLILAFYVIIYVPIIMIYRYLKVEKK